MLFFIGTVCLQNDNKTDVRVGVCYLCDVYNLYCASNGMYADVAWSTPRSANSSVYLPPG